MNYALATIWHERSRFLPAILAVAFSAVLIAVQAGLLVGLLSMMSTPVDKAAADIWVGHDGVQSVDLGRVVPTNWKHRLQREGGQDVEEVVLSFAQWAVPANASRPSTLNEICMIIGTELKRNSIATAEPIRRDPQLMAALAEPYSVLIDRSERSRLGVSTIG